MRYMGKVYRPPSEAYSLIVQVTYGCSHNRCAFCDMYDDKRFTMRPMEEIREDFEMARQRYRRVERIFLADGDALMRKTDDLVQILTQPKNALVKQYQKLLEYDDVELQFQPEALDAVADQAIQRNIGARGLRAVMEGLLTRIMYEIPSDPTITRVTITPEAVLKTGEPEITRDPQRTERPGRTRDGKAEHDPSAPAS